MNTTSPLSPAAPFSGRPLSLRRGREAACLQLPPINQIIVDEKSLSDIMLSTGSLSSSPHRRWGLYGAAECFLWLLVFSVCCLETKKGGKSSTVLAKVEGRLALHNNAKFVKRRWYNLMTLVQPNINGLLHGVIRHGDAMWMGGRGYHCRALSPGVSAAGRNSRDARARAAVRCTCTDFYL